MGESKKYKERLSSANHDNAKLKKKLKQMKAALEANVKAQAQAQKQIQEFTIQLEEQKGG